MATNVMYVAIDNNCTTNDVTFTANKVTCTAKSNWPSKLPPTKSVYEDGCVHDVNGGLSDDNGRISKVNGQVNDITKSRLLTRPINSGGVSNLD